MSADLRDPSDLDLPEASELRELRLIAGVSVAEAAGIIIVNGCNGLSTIGLFSGFVLAFPGRWARRAWFLPVGAVVLYLSNVVRVALLAGLQPHWPSAFDGLHAVGTQFFYLVVFGLWVLWVRYGGFGAADA